MMRRSGTVVIIVVLMVLLNAPWAMAGGANPGNYPGGVKITGPAVSAVVVIDFSNFGSFLRASIRAQKGTLSAGQVFTTAQSYGLDCDGTINNVVTQTNVRFLNVPPAPNNNFHGVNNLLSDWVDADALSALLNKLGLGSAGTPVITDIDSAVCTPNGDTGDLSFTAVIQFQVAQ
jgi:hypothetical protein